MKSIWNCKPLWIDGRHSLWRIKKKLRIVTKSEQPVATIVEIAQEHAIRAISPMVVPLGPGRSCSEERKFYSVRPVSPH